MQLIPRYLVKNRINIIANDLGFITEYRPVYQRQIQLYKGIDNKIEFKLLNADQKPINTGLYNIYFQAFDENKNLVIDKVAETLDDGSSNAKGLFSVTVADSDTLNLKQQFLSYVVYLVDANEERVITYTDTHFGNAGIIKLSSDAFPGVKSSKTITAFYANTQDTSEYVTEAIDAEPGINGNEALHTAVFYTNNFQGTITVQASLENQITGTTEWADVTSVALDGTETEPTPVNFNGVFRWVRFKVDADPANTITKVLVRN